MTDETQTGWRNLSFLNSTRGLVLMGLSAVAGLVIAAIGLFTAKGTTTLYVPPEDVALVNQQPIVRSDYLAQIKLLYDTDFAHATPAQRQKALDDMIREELFVQRGTELDVAASDPGTRAAMVSAVESQAIMDAMTEVPSDEKLMAYYNANKPRYSSEGFMNLRDVVFPAGTSPETLAAARALSADQAIARFGARDSGKVTADEFYFAEDIHLGKDLSAKAKALNDGGVSEPVTLGDGVHIIYMIKNTRPVAFDFTKAKPQILADYRKDNAKRMLAHEEEFLKKRAQILVSDELK
jgi:hypothetical protein